MSFSLQESARQQYVDLVSSLLSSESSSHVKESPPDSKSIYETIEVSTKDNITKIVLNRPEKKNAINVKVMQLKFRSIYFILPFVI